MLALIPDHVQYHVIQHNQCACEWHEYGKKEIYLNQVLDERVDNGKNNGKDTCRKERDHHGIGESLPELMLIHFKIIYGERKRDSHTDEWYEEDAERAV